MTFWIVILIINGVLGLILFCYYIVDFINDKKQHHKIFLDETIYQLLICLVPLPILIIGIFKALYETIRDYKKDKISREEDLLREQKQKAEREERERIRNHIREEYRKGNLARHEIPRTLNGVNHFEFSPKLTLANKRFQEVGDIIYVENEYCESLNRFFMSHKGLRLYHMYRFIYLPNLCKEDSEHNELMHYLYPNLKDYPNFKPLDSTYPIQFLCYPEDRKKIKHGMMFLSESSSNDVCIPFVTGSYFHLEEGTDEEIIKQLDDIVHKVHDIYASACLYSLAEKPDLPEGKTTKYADELFSWVVYDDNIAIVTEEIRKKIQSLKTQGIAQKLLIKLIPEEPSLSRLVITKDFRIVLPDYQNMEIKMEPLNKAVYLLFLKHPEGIIFKHLTDYRKELIEIYTQLRPLGMTERAMHSIEDVTNPTLNSINEKCARIRGAFISQFDENLAKNYFITGQRGEAKKILLPRELVEWEEEI